MIIERFYVSYDISTSKNKGKKKRTSLISSVVLGSKYNSGEQENVVDQFVNL